VLAQTVADALAGTALDPPQPLDVDVDELAGARALVADRLLEPDPAEPAQAEAAEDARDCRERHLQRLGDLGRRETQRPQCHDHLDSLLRRPVRNLPWRRRAIDESRLALAAVAAHPLASAAHADAGGLRRRLQRPSLDHDPFRQPTPAVPAEGGVTVQLHPVSSLDWVLGSPQPPGRPG
jgi:hypothetical protein